LIGRLPPKVLIGTPYSLYKTGEMQASAEFTNRSEKIIADIKTNFIVSPFVQK
jgi:hypothetical protein